MLLYSGVTLNKKKQLKPIALKLNSGPLSQLKNSDEINAFL